MFWDISAALPSCHINKIMLLCVYFSCMSFLSCRNVWNFAHALKFKADFYSQMSVCRHELGELPPQPPGNSNPHTIDKRFAHYTKKKVCIMYLVRRRSTAVRGRLLHRTVAASVAVTGDDVMIAGYSPSGSPWLGIMIGCVCWCKPVPTLYHWRHSDVQQRSTYSTSRVLLEQSSNRRVYCIDCS